MRFWSDDNIYVNLKLSLAEKSRGLLFLRFDQIAFPYIAQPPNKRKYSDSALSLTICLLTRPKIRDNA